MKGEVDDWRGNHESAVKQNDDLIDKLGDVAEENGRLLMKCQQLEVQVTSTRVNAKDDYGRIFINWVEFYLVVWPEPDTKWSFVKEGCLTEKMQLFAHSSK